MQLFFTNQIEGEMAFLNEVEARHCVQVLRKKTGDLIFFIDGKGGFYEAEIVETGKKRCVLKILNREEGRGKKSWKLHLAVAPPKNIDRLEWFLEKATEIGIDEITPLLCQRSERRKIRNERLEKILLSATKQSLKAYVPKLNELTDFGKFVANTENLRSSQNFIAYCNDDQLNHLKKQYKVGEDATILIGPEGDFSPEEIKLAIENGYTGTSLGKSRLRTETAGIVACHVVNLVNSE